MKRVSRLGPLEAHFARIGKSGTDEPERIYVFSAKMTKAREAWREMGGFGRNASQQ
jgi:hypothetical protein